MAKVAYFGVGCLHFGYTRKERFTISGDEYVADVKVALESVPSISRIQIRLNDEARAKEQVEEVMRRSFAAPSEQAARLIDMYERRRANRINVMGFVVASILGGVVGAVITLLVH